MSNFPKKRGINRKLLITVIFVTSLYAMLTAFLFYKVELNRSQERTTSMINQLIDTVEYSSAIATYTGNRQIADDVIHGLLRNDIVRRVEIKDDQELKIAQSKATMSDQAAVIERQLFSPFDKKQKIGIITVTSEYSYVLEEARYSAMLSAINSSLIILITSSIVLLIVRKNVVKPLTTVSNSLHKIMNGENDRLQSLLGNNDDELALLIEEINNLLDKLDDKYKNERNLRKKVELIEKQLRNIFESTSAGLFLLDVDGKLLTYNPTFAEIVFANHEQTTNLSGQFFPELFQEHMQIQQMLTNALSYGQLVTADLLLKKQDDKPYQWVHCLLSKITQENVIVRYEGVIFDITSRLEQEKAIRFQAEYDSLTKVFRRDTAEARLAKFLTESPDTPIVVMLLDLDGFKAINDNFGHDAGDEVLVEIADRFKKNLRGDDVVARLGGDEFFIILYRCEPINAELLLAEKIINAVCQPIQLKSNRSVRVGVSIGMASNYYFKDVDNLIKAADQEMYEVKRNGKNGFALKKNNGEHIIKIFNAGKSIAFFR